MNTKEILKKYIFRDNSYLMNIITQIRIHQKSIILRKYGHHLLQDLFETAKSRNLPVWLEYGSLLGAYREHSFIKHDFDIDCCMRSEDYSLAFEDALLAKGFYKIRAFYLYNKKTKKEKLTEVTFDYYGLHIDIFLNDIDETTRIGYGYRVIDKAHTIQKEFKVFQASLPYVKGLSTLPIDNIEYPVPTNTEELLQFYYGKTFMTPIPNYTSTEKKKEYFFYEPDKIIGILKGFRSLHERKKL